MALIGIDAIGIDAIGIDAIGIDAIGISPIGSDLIGVIPISVGISMIQMGIVIIVVCSKHGTMCSCRCCVK